MAFHDDILRDLTAGRVRLRFKTRDLKSIPAARSGYYRVGNGEYSESTINTVPRNHSVRPDGTCPGDYVRKGREPAFLWHGNGEYELIIDHQHRLKNTGFKEAAFEDTEGDDREALVAVKSESITAPIVDEALVLRIATSEWHNPAAIIFRYIAEKPYQVFYRRKPVGPIKQGWGERLAAYYWPSQDRDWKITCCNLTGLSSRIQQAIRKLEAFVSDQAAAAELLIAFEETCAWGGVNLPESDSSVLAKEVLCTYQALSDGRMPPAMCRLNSAWTKLYAFALPEKCVIYDSRVAAALTSILDPAMNLVTRGPKWQSYAALGTIPGRGGSRPRDMRWSWPTGYRSWQSQMAANLLSRDVLKEINCQRDCRKLNDPSPWTLREVEAVLFMEGY